jgi:hypothetical protein
MKTYTCICGQITFFENVACVACGRELGFLPDAPGLSSLEPAGDGLFAKAGDQGQKNLYRKCRNYANESVCNWMIVATEAVAENAEPFCLSCRLNQTIPDLTIKENHALWARMEAAKHRLVYSLLNLKLPIASKMEDPKQGLAFAFLSDTVKPDGSISKVLTGHDNGLVTLNVAEADDAAREKMRLAMKEPYRTLLGHFRHEIGHYYWDRLVRATELLKPCRELFGDEQASYAEALGQYYSAGAPANWQDHYISAYATSHPWEDWAETWAHFMHIQDALEVASDFGLAGKTIRIDPKISAGKPWLSSRQSTFEEIVGAWSELAIALNSMNRSMGLQDIYPFVLSPAVIHKLHFIFDVISAGARRTAATSKG